MRLTALAAALVLATFPRHSAAAEPDPAAVCDLAATKAERDWRVPPGVLAAVGTVESGRSAGRGGASAPWPWTINAGGQGFHFATKREAIAAVVGYWQSGVAYIDVGCFQVDLAFHGDKFASLDDAFDPERNAHEAARILVAGRFGPDDWPGAVARYHSAEKVRGGEYLNRVRAVFPGSRARAWSAQLGADVETGYAVLLSPQARAVHVVTTTDSPVERPADATGPAVGPTLHNLRAPQIIYMGRPGALPIVVQARPVEVAGAR